jgi:hypothetical protein
MNLGVPIMPLVLIALFAMLWWRVASETKAGVLP